MDIRIFVEKRAGFDNEAARLFNEICEVLSIAALDSVCIFQCYDIFNLPEKNFQEAVGEVFSDSVTDIVHESFPAEEGTYIAVEFLPGHFDQRADSAEQCLMLLSDDNRDVCVRSGKVFVFGGSVSLESLKKIESYLVNPLEMRVKDLSVLEREPSQDAAPVCVYEGFTALDEGGIEDFHKSHGLAMSVEDLRFIQSYFQKEEGRDPTETEVKVLDTYWSDHCRHTTFETSLTDIIFPQGSFGHVMEEAFAGYLRSRLYVYGESVSQEERPYCLMDMATILCKEYQKSGDAKDLDISEEVNACSIFRDVDRDGVLERWLLMFKNETHNHPTEIEPFGGASTCIGGAIRDPLSGRSFVYQAMRVTGCGDPFQSIEETLPGKLPQRKITREAAHGYSSYGNQIGLATTHVSEIYDEGYTAKRMEIGAVVGAAPASHIVRARPIAGDVVLLVGGRTGRDGCGGATGSSKEHDSSSLSVCAAEVQKGNAPEERKLQRLFRRSDAASLIKRCNDFGAGGVSVAVGELSSGLEIDLDSILVKYDGLSGTELAISESQERMAVVVAPCDAATFMAIAGEENLEVVQIASVTDRNRLVMRWRGEMIVDLSRAFLDTHGVRRVMNVVIEEPSFKAPFKALYPGEDFRVRYFSMLSSLNVCCQKGLVEMFDATIGATTVLMPFGGKYQRTPEEGSVQKFPLQEGETNTASVMSWGYNPVISSWSPFHGGIYAVIEALAKIAAMGADWRDVRFSCQEYFRKLEEDPLAWGQPVAALLGAQEAMRRFKLPAIGGKDSMSGTFKDKHVPPTLVAFAVTTMDVRHTVSSSFKKAGSYLYLISHRADGNFMPDTECLKANFTFLHQAACEGKILSAMSLKYGGVAAALSKMGFGNGIGFSVVYDKEDLLSLNYGSIIVEVSSPLEYAHAVYLGKTEDSGVFVFNGVSVSLLEASDRWLGVLDSVFPRQASGSAQAYPLRLYRGKGRSYTGEKFARPHVLLPFFPGTNCEYDSARIFRRAGAVVDVLPFLNISESSISASIDSLVQGLLNAQVFMLPGGFSAGDEPEGAGKFIVAVLMNRSVREALERFLERDGLILGICNGFQALLKSGLLPYGCVGGEMLSEASVRASALDLPYGAAGGATLTYNRIGRHVSMMSSVKVVSGLSPWFSSENFEKVYQTPMSHGEGCFMACESVIESLFSHGQVATQYVDFAGFPTSDGQFNPNGSVYGIEGITSLDGRILGKMGHVERYDSTLYKNIEGETCLDIFSNAVRYFS